MAGRNKQPLQVIKGKGRSNHITKAEMKKREEHEERMRGPIEDIKAPSYLTAVQKREFDEIAEKLVALEIFSELDIDNLARYLDSKHQYIQLVKEFQRVKPTEVVEDDEGNEHIIANGNYSKLQKTKSALFTECRSAAGDLGLSITSRLKLVIPSPPDNQGKSEAEKRFSGRL